MSSRLPDEIIEENILTRLPVKSIARLRCVSRNWRLLFRNPNFIRNHLTRAIQMNKFNILVRNHKDSNNLDVVSSASSLAVSGHAVKIDYPFMPRESRECLVIGSCNGLVCINSFSSEVCIDSLSEAGICIWNPATREYKQVPKSPKPAYPRYKVYGFGYDCKNDDYTVLRIAGYKEVSVVILYSLRSNSWKNLGSVPYNFSPYRLNKGLFHNGVLHWIATGLKPNVLVCYNVSDETFSHVPLPNNISDDDWRNVMPDLGIWEGKLCLLLTNHMEDVDMCTHQNDHVDVWTMMGSKWSKHLKITAQLTDMYYRRPIQTLHNGEVLCEGGSIEERGTGFISYDSKLERARALKIHGLPDRYDVVTYIETLVALNSGTYVGQ